MYMKVYAYMCVPVYMYMMANAHHLFLTINSSVNILIYCCVGKEFRDQLKRFFIRPSPEPLAN